MKLLNEKKRIPNKPLTSQEIGKLTESEVASCIAEVIPFYSENCSHNTQQKATKHGDRHLIAETNGRFPGLHIFLEVKNDKETIKIDEIERFNRQVYH